MAENKLCTVLSSDGSSTIFNVELNQHYHSMHGAVNESMHVFINAGLKQISKPQINIFEMGFGTGLNALLSNIHSGQSIIHYTSVEKYPVSEQQVKELNYPLHLGVDPSEFNLLHSSAWDSLVKINEGFYLHKMKKDLKNIQEDNIDLIYFDAFSSEVQPELWTDEILRMMYDMLVPSGILVTYSARGELKRGLKRVGFTIYSIPGPPGKREMVRAVKHE